MPVELPYFRKCIMIGILIRRGQASGYFLLRSRMEGRKSLKKYGRVDDERIACGI